MKRIATIALLLCSMVAVAQTGQWAKTTTDGDDLLGIADVTIYTYDIPGIGKMVINDWCSNHFVLIANDPLAVDRSTGSERNSGVDMLVGIYNRRGHLCERLHLWMSPVYKHSDRIVEPHTAWLGVPIRQTKKIRHIFDVLRADDGRYLRIVCQRAALPAIDTTIKQYHTSP